MAGASSACASPRVERCNVGQLRLGLGGGASSAAGNAKRRSDGGDEGGNVFLGMGEKHGDVGGDDGDECLPDCPGSSKLSTVDGILRI